MIRRIVAIAMVGSMLAGCGDDDPTGPGPLTPVASLSIDPIPDTLLARQQVKLVVRAFAQDGSHLPDRPVLWESADPAVASVTAGGVLTASAPGTTVIRAVAEDAIDSAAVTVRTLVLAHVFAGASR